MGLSKQNIEGSCVPVRLACSTQRQAR